MRFRIRWELRGGHVHCRVFAGRGLTLGKCGELVFTSDEWAQASESFDRAGFEILHEPTCGDPRAQEQP